MKSPTRNKSRRNPRGGFTLLEVMVAMAILATVLVVLLENHSMSIRMSQRARQNSLASNLARDLLTEVEIEGFPEINTEAGDFSQKYPGLFTGFSWERSISESAFVDFIREVVVRVTYMEGDIPHTVELIEMIGAKTTDEQAQGGVSSGENQFSPAEQALMGSMGRSSESGAGAGSESEGRPE
jgi:general secretion pathway protein I